MRYTTTGVIVASAVVVLSVAAADRGRAQSPGSRATSALPPAWQRCCRFTSRFC